MFKYDVLGVGFNRNLINPAPLFQKMVQLLNNLHKVNNDYILLYYLDKIDNNYLLLYFR